MYWITWASVSRPDEVGKGKERRKVVTRSVKSVLAVPASDTAKISRGWCAEIGKRELRRWTHKEALWRISGIGCEVLTPTTKTGWVQVAKASLSIPPVLTSSPLSW